MSEQQDAPRRGWRRYVPKPLRRTVTLLLALLVIEYLVIPKFAIASKQLHQLKHLNVPLLVLAVLLEAGALFTYALLTRTLLPEDALGIGTLFEIDLATTAVAHVIPGGTAGSASLGYRLFTSRGVRGRDAAFAMATQGLGSAVVLNVLLWGSLVISIPLAGAHGVYVLVAMIGVLAILALSALVYSFTRGEESARRFIRAIGRRVPRLNEERLEASVAHIGGRLRDLWRDRELLRKAIGWAAANWLLDAACLWTFFAALGRVVDPILLFAAYGIANVAAVIPVTPGGLGVVEGTTVALLSASGVPAATATLGVIGWRLVNFWLPIPVGVGCYISLRTEHGAGFAERRRALRRMAREATESPPLRSSTPAIPSPGHAGLSAPGGRPFHGPPASPSVADAPRDAEHDQGGAPAMTTLSIALGDYPHTRALRDPALWPKGYELDFAPVNGPMPPFFRRQVRNFEFDICEMALTTYLCAQEFNYAFTAIPIFVFREFSNRHIFVNANAGITEPKQLEGKRIGLRAYTVTIGVWGRAVLADRYGVDLDNVTWVVADDEHVVEVDLPGNVEPMYGANIAELVSAGELDGAIGIPPSTPNAVRLLSEEEIEEGERNWASRGIYPINHTVIIKNDVLEEHPDLARGLYVTLDASHNVYLDRLAAGVDLSEDEVEFASRRDLVGPDPYPSGIEASRTTIETLINTGLDQHIINTAPSVDSLFVPGAEV